jgi:hypothetical protein
VPSDQGGTTGTKSGPRFSWPFRLGLFSREHAVTTPHGQITGTDPLNFERQKTITLRDGRTVEHTYSQSWDGQTLERERTFAGPNGQTLSSQQSLSWDGQGDPPDGGQPTMSRTPATTGGEGSRPPVSRPKGFTLGSSARGNWGASGNGVVRRQAGEPESAPVKARRTRTEHRQLLASQPDPQPRPHQGPRR